MIVWKPIKPKRLKDDAFRLEILNEVRKTGRDIRKDFEKTTATWKRKPEFDIDISLTAPGPIVEVSTDNKIYRFVNDGTDPHPIFAGIFTGKSNKKALAFFPSSTPKTAPGIIGSGSGSQSGDRVARPYVDHPGTKARNFDETIAKKWEKLFKRRMEAAMVKGAKKSGYML